MRIHFKRIVSALCATVVSATMLFVTVSAAEGDDFTCKLGVNDTAKADSVFEDGDTGIPGLTYGEGSFTWDGGVSLSEKTNKEQEKAITAFNKKVSDAGFSASATNDINDMLSQTSPEATINMQTLLMLGVFDQTKGDLTGGMGVISPFLPYINIIIGAVAILLVTLLVASTVIDLACIGLPAMRDWVITKNTENAGGGNGGGGEKPKAITYAAWATIREVEGGDGNKGSGKNAYFVYFKKRIFDYIVLGICLSLLIFGGFSNFMRAFFEIGNTFSG